MIKQEIRKPKVQKRHQSIRVKLSGTGEFPRLAVYRSTKHIYAQLIDDEKHVTIASASSVDKELKEKLAHGGNIEAAKVFAKDDEVVWQCRNCGYIHVGKEAPEECPACKHPQAYFEVKKENY